MDNLRVHAYNVEYSAKQIRKAAAVIFRNRWKKIFAAGLLMMLIAYIPAILLPYIKNETLFALAGAVYTLVMMIAGGHMVWGYTAFIMKGLREDETSDLDVLTSGFRRFGRVLCTYLLLGLKITGLVMAVLITDLLSSWFVACMGSIAAGSTNWLFPLFMIIFFIFYMAGCIWVFLRYELTFFIGIDYPDARAGMLSKASAILMKGSKKKLLFLLLTFAGWFILMMAVVIGIILLLTYSPVEPGIVYLLLLLVPGVFTSSLLMGYVLTAIGIFYSLLTGKGEISEEGFFLYKEPEPETEPEAVEEPVNVKKKNLKKYILAGVLAVTTIGGIICLVCDFPERVGVYDDDFLGVSDDFITLESAEIAAGNLSFTVSNGDGWIYFDEESAWYSYMGPDEYVLSCSGAEMMDPPYDIVHLSSYGGEGCSMETVRDFVNECWYYEDELVLEETVEMAGHEAAAEVYFDGAYYYLNIYLEKGEEYYHIYAAADTLAEAEDYIKQVRNTLTIE